MNVPNVEPTELGANDKEHSKWLLGILDLGQEVGRETERQRNLGRLIKVGLEYMSKGADHNVQNQV
jgi:hypothetical protein